MTIHLLANTNNPCCMYLMKKKPRLKMSVIQMWPRSDTDCRVPLDCTVALDCKVTPDCKEHPDCIVIHDCRVTPGLWPQLWPVWVGPGNPHDVFLTLKWLHSIYPTTTKFRPTWRCPKCSLLQQEDFLLCCIGLVFKRKVIFEN